MSSITKIPNFYCGDCAKANNLPQRSVVVVTECNVCNRVRLCFRTSSSVMDYTMYSDVFSAESDKNVQRGKRQQ